MSVNSAAEHGICLLLESIVDAVNESVPDEGIAWWWSNVSELPWELTLLYDYNPSIEQQSTISHFLYWGIARLHEVAAEMGKGFEHIVHVKVADRVWEIYFLAEAAAIVHDRGPFRIELFSSEDRFDEDPKTV